MTKLTKWTPTDCGSGVYRALSDSDGNNIRNRVALIEKTARVRIRPAYLGEDRVLYDDGVTETVRRWPEHLDWYSCYSGTGASDMEARAHCDRLLLVMGYDLET